VTGATASLMLDRNRAGPADAIRWRVLALVRDLDIPALCEEAGLDPQRFSELAVEPHPSAELVGWVARFAGVPVGEVIYGPSSEAGADGVLAALGAASTGDLLEHLAGRLARIDERIERAMLALMELETRLSAAGLAPSDLIPAELIPMYAPLTCDPPLQRASA
jgi:hypothetical protein